MLAPIVISAASPPSAPRPAKPAAAIAAASAGWFQADDRYLTLDGANISAWSNRGPGALTMSLIAGATPATLQSDVLEGLTVARHGVGGTSRYQVNGTFDTRVPFAVACVIKPTTVGALQQIWGRVDSGSARVALTVASGASVASLFYRGSAYSVPIPIGSWSACLVDFDGTTLRVRAAGVTSTEVAQSADTASGLFMLGGSGGGASPLIGDTSDLILFGQSIWGSPAMDAVGRYVDGAYSLAL